MEWVLRGIGLFYALAGLAYVRSFSMDKVLDDALRQLNVDQPPAELASDRWLKAMAALTVASGLALLTLSVWIAPLMILNALVQGLWLLWARKALPPENEAEALGRRRTINAFIIWLLATALALSVVWGAQSPVVTTGAANWLAPVGGVVFLVWLMMK